MSKEKHKKLRELLFHRGFIFPSSDIYNGLEASWDWGPLGVQLKRNIKDLWWDDIVLSRDDIFGLDSSIFMSTDVWKASGHLDSFNDPLVECKECNRRFRKDKIDTDNCPECEGEFTEEKPFNLMFDTNWGPVEDENSKVYMRPETAQGIFVNFKKVKDSMRAKLPFGIAQIGKAFRNEITVGNFIFRTREFEQMELEYFVKPEQADEMLDFWIEKRLDWYEEYGIDRSNLRARDLPDEELAHYAKRGADIEYEYDFGFDEVEGVMNRGDYDLKKHQKESGKKLTYFDPEKEERYFPFIIEPSVGVERLLFAFLAEAYREEEVGEDKTRKVLSLDPRVAPIQASVFPLVSNEEDITELAQEVYRGLLGEFRVDYDEKGSIGKRYRRNDEIGTPYCITIDYDSLEDNAVTIRDRESMEQDRISIDKLSDYLEEDIHA